MCLVAIAWRAHPRYPLILLGNRDEFHARPAASADWWPDAPDILGGRDLKAGGTWLAVHRAGRVAVVTNYPGRPAPDGDAPSRGSLVREFMAADGDVANFFSGLGAREERYAGFSLLAATPVAAGLFAAAGTTASIPALVPGIHALSNSPLNDPWPKVGWLTRRLGSLLGAASETTTTGLLDLLMNRGPVADDTRLPRVASRPFVLGDDYGTRASTVVLVDRDGLVRFSERRYGPGGTPAGESHFAFEIRPKASPGAA